MYCDSRCIISIRQFFKWTRLFIYPRTETERGRGGHIDRDVHLQPPLQFLKYTLEEIFIATTPHPIPPKVTYSQHSRCQFTSKQPQVITTKLQPHSQPSRSTALSLVARGPRNEIATSSRSPWTDGPLAQDTLPSHIC